MPYTIDIQAVAVLVALAYVAGLVTRWAYFDTQRTVIVHRRGGKRANR